MTKKELKRRAVSLASAVLLLAGSLTMDTGIAFAGGDTLPPRKGEQGYRGENQPSYHGYRKQDLLDWSPKTDEYSDFMRAKIPLQKRNEAFNATQANPLLDQEVASLSLAGDYGNEFFSPTIYNDKFAQNVFNFWQYEDIYASWHGTVNNPTPETLYAADAPWYERKYEFGILNIPNPAYTNAAHKNGVLSLGCIFFPRNEHPQDWIYKDKNGRFPIADKLVEMAEYYGYDGYFVNAEEKVPKEFMKLYAEFMKSMTSRGLYVQVYASNPYGPDNEDQWGGIDYYNKTAAIFSNWLKKEGESSIYANSLYMNPDPSKEHVDSSVAAMEALGLNPKKTVFNTIEAGQTGFSGKRGSLYNTLDENLVPRTAIASLGNTSCWEHLDENLFGHSGDNSYEENRRGDSDYQKYVFARERTWWTGSQNQPYYSGDSTYIGEQTYLQKPTTEYTDSEKQALAKLVLEARTNPHLTATDPDRAKPRADKDKEGKEYQSWPGMAAFISERSVINGTNFYTNFNTGHGLQYFVDGKVSNDNEWANINIQDILPTWQWWMEAVNDPTNTDAKNGVVLDVDFDYGKKYNPAFERKQIGGYKGGSSLVVKGDLIKENFLRLYKTDLSVNKNTNLDITYYKPSKTDESQMKLGLIFKDAPTKTEYVPIEGTGEETTKWVSKSVDLSQYAGREIAAFGLSFQPENGIIKDYQMNIGEIKITDGSVAKPKAPSGLKIEKAFDTTETYISWKLDNYEKVRQYNVYAEFEDGREVFLGGNYDSVYYIKSLYNPKGKVKIKVTAVGLDGTESEPAVVTRDFSKVITNVKVKEKTGSITASWSNKKTAFNKVKMQVKFDYSNKKGYSKTFGAGTKTGTIKIPVSDGSNYTLRISLLDKKNKVISYVDHKGQLKDNSSDVYRGKAVYEDGTIRLTQPTAYDWWHIYITQNKTPISVADDNNFYYRGQELSGFKVENEVGIVEVVLEDFAGNLSKPVSVLYAPKGKTAITKDIFPDPVLRKAVMKKAGSLNELKNITSLDLKGTDVSSLEGIALLQNLKSLNVSNCNKLTKIDSLAGSAKLKTINITGCKNLRILDIANTEIETITYGKTSGFKKLISVDVSGTKLKLTAKSPEKKLLDAVKKQAKGKKDIVLRNTKMSNLSVHTAKYSIDGAIAQPYDDGGDSKDNNIMAMFDDNKSTNAWIGNITKKGESIIDFELKTPMKVEGFSITASEKERCLGKFEMYYSTDGVTYELMGKPVTDNEEKTYTQSVSGIPKAKYFRLVGKEGKFKENLYLAEIELLGYDTTTYPAGVKTSK